MLAAAQNSSKTIVAILIAVCTIQPPFLSTTVEDEHTAGQTQTELGHRPAAHVCKWHFPVLVGDADFRPVLKAKPT